MYRRTATKENSIKHASSKSHISAKGAVTGNLNNQQQQQQPLISSDTGSKRTALSTVTNTTASSSLLDSKKSNNNNFKQLLSLSTKPVVTDEKFTFLNTQKQDVNNKILPDSLQTNHHHNPQHHRHPHHQYSKQNNHINNTRQKQTTVWTDDRVQSSDSAHANGLESRSTKITFSNHRTDPASSTQPSSTHPGNLKRKSHTFNNDDTEPEENTEYFDDDTEAHQFRSSVKQNKTTDSSYASYRPHASDHDYVSSNGKFRFAATQSRSNRSRKSTGTQRLLQKNRIMKQQRKSLDPAIEAAIGLGAADKLRDWPFNEMVAEKLADYTTTSLLHDAKAFNSSSQSKPPTLQKARYPNGERNPKHSETLPVVTGTTEENGSDAAIISREKLVSKDENSLQNHDEAELEALSSETEVVLSPRVPNKNLDKNIGHVSASKGDTQIIPNNSAETLQFVEEEEDIEEDTENFENTIAEIEVPSPRNPYQVTITSRSRTNPHALFPIWDDEALAKMEAVNKTFENMPGIFDEEDEDTYDISMVTEYSNDIFFYMHKLEFLYRPDPSYMDKQVEIDWTKRGILIDWLVRVHAHCNLLPETLFLTVNYIDRFLSLKAVEQSKFQLVGVAALFIAAKYEEITCPSVQELSYIVENEYSVEEILQAERYMIGMLEFNMGWPGPMSFLRRSSKADDYDADSRTVAKYLLELTIMDQRFVGAQPSWLAAAAHSLAKTVLDRGSWSDLHVYFGGYTKKQLEPAIDRMIYVCKKPLTHHRSIYEKYSEERFKWASLYVHRWMCTTHGVKGSPS